MPKRQLLVLFACNFISFLGINTLMSLLPVHLEQLGADSTRTGTFFSTNFFALGMGTVVAGWLLDRYRRRKLMLIGASAVAIPMMWLMGQTRDLTQLALVSVVYWFTMGIFFSTLNVLTGLFATEDERGRIFGLLSSAVAMSGVLSGAISGRIADAWGFTALFTATSVVLLSIPFIALLLEEYKDADSAAQQGTAKRSFTLSKGFMILFAATVLGFIVNSAGTLFRPLLMTGMGFGATDVSTTVAVGALIGLPLPFLVGWLSDRIGRKPLLILCFLANALGLVVLLGAFSAWHFWLSMAFQISMAASMAVGSALIADLVPAESLGVSLSLFTFANSVGFVIGFASTGSAMQHFGTSTTLLLGCALAFASVALLTFIRITTPNTTANQVAPATP
ncbi:MAG: MFS transporter [Anaerolineae bacterium]